MKLEDYRPANAFDQLTLRDLWMLATSITFISCSTPMSWRPRSDGIVYGRRTVGRTRRD